MISSIDGLLLNSNFFHSLIYLISSNFDYANLWKDSFNGQLILIESSAMSSFSFLLNFSRKYLFLATS